jgi:DNA-binding transcriptional LysR family regulator
MDLNATRMFVAVAQAGSLSAAATRLGTPLPTLSRRIRDLERQLRVQLLERSARGTKLHRRRGKAVRARQPRDRGAAGGRTSRDGRSGTPEGAPAPVVAPDV